MQAFIMMLGIASIVVLVNVQAFANTFVDFRNTQPIEQVEPDRTVAYNSNVRPISYCGIEAEVILTPVAELNIDGDHTYQEMLYKYDGDRHIVKLPVKLTREQADLLVYAYNVAKTDGHREPAVLQGVIWQESHAGGYTGYEVAGDEAGLTVGKRYYGVGQIKVAAAKDVFKRFHREFPEFYQPGIREKQPSGDMKTVQFSKYLKTDEEIIAHLIMDKQFNIRVASKYLWMMGHNETRNYQRPTNFAITAYNRGPSGVSKNYNKWHYTVAVNKHKNNIMRPFNKQNKSRLD